MMENKTNYIAATDWVPYPSPPLTEDPLLLDFLAFADKRGGAERARAWVSANEQRAAGRVAEAVLKSGCRRNAFRAVLRDVTRGKASIGG
jgi:hypothetical protein